MPDYLSVEEARERAGVRVALTAGVPGPWGEATKALLKVRKIEYAPVLQVMGEANDALAAWTGHRNAPIVVYNDEPARVGWAEILFLTERLGNGPSLIPHDPDERATMMGLSHEICGENGLGWARRLNLLHPSIEAGPDDPGYELSARFGRWYGYSDAAGRASARRAAEVLGVLSRQLASQRAAGREFLVGNALSAVDLYWAAFCALVEPLPDDLSVHAMPPGLRALYESSPPEVREAASPELLAHRDFLYREVIGLPLDF